MIRGNHDGGWASRYVQEVGDVPGDGAIEVVDDGSIEPSGNVKFLPCVGSGAVVFVAQELLRFQRVFVLEPPRLV